MTDTNRSLAQLFLSISDKLAARRENPHRIRAYRRAAESLVNMEEDIRAVAERGALQDIPGIGRDLSAKILEFLKTGAIQTYEELKTPLPPEIAAWTTLPGLSEAVVQHLYVKLGIRTLEDLEALVRTHLLRTLPGMTASEEDLLAAIQARRAAEQPPRVS
ncbi:MAG: histidinol-phosphatase [Nitrospirae bacterium]|nr:histidinol-phosphatase [Nitrospirota bacterium]